MGIASPRPAHWKATLGASTAYACVVHEDKLREHAEDRAPVFAVDSQERMSAGVWCNYCNDELQGANK